MKAARRTDVLAKLLEGRRAAEVRAAAGLPDRGILQIYICLPERAVSRRAARAAGSPFAVLCVCFVGVEEMCFVSVPPCVRLIVSAVRSAGMVRSR